MPGRLNDTIPFGRFKGRRVHDLPDAYLKWAFTIVERPLLQFVIEELIQRGISPQEVLESWRRNQWNHQERRRARQEEAFQERASNRSGYSRAESGAARIDERLRE